jgi:hypothetical protein
MGTRAAAGAGKHAALPKASASHSTTGSDSAAAWLGVV